MHNIIIIPSHCRTQKESKGENNPKKWRSGPPLSPLWDRKAGVYDDVYAKSNGKLVLLEKCVISASSLSRFPVYFYGRPAAMYYSAVVRNDTMKRREV